MASDRTLSRSRRVRPPTASEQLEALLGYRVPMGRPPKHDLSTWTVTDDWPEDVPVRLHSSCLTGDLFGSLRCDCGDQLHCAMQKVQQEGKGVILYMNQEGRGIGLLNKLKAYKLQENGMDTVEANLHLGFPMDKRDYGIGAQMLRYLGISKLRLMSNNPRKRAGLLGYGIEVVETVPIEIEPNVHNEKYLTTKRDKMGHEILKK